MKIFIIILLILLSLYVIHYLNFNYNFQIKTFSEEDSTKKFVKDKDDDNFNKRIESYKKKYKVKNIVACVFYGRKVFTEILFRYLDRNLRRNGGILDKIIILNHLMGSKTNVTMEKEFLKEYLDSHKYGYEVFEFNNGEYYPMMYSVLRDDDLVFKIDDDTVFIANNTFKNMVEDYFINNRFILSANVINHHSLSVLHANMNLMLPFYEITNNKWILSDNKTTNKSLNVFNECIKDYKMWRVKTECSVIAHESFLYNIYENNFNLNMYNFQLFEFLDKKSQSTYRWRINFILFTGRDLNKIGSLYPNLYSDEQIITVALTNAKKKINFALGSAVVAHFSYYQHIKYMEKTNTIKKYDKLSFDYFK